MYNVMCSTCHKLVKIASFHGSRCPKCFQLIRIREDEYEKKKHDDGTDILVPLVLLNLFSSSDSIHDELSAPDFQGGGGAYGGGGTSESWDSDSGGSSE